MVLLASWFYALQNIRIGVLIEDFHPVRFATGQAAVIVVPMAIWFCIDIYSSTLVNQKLMIWMSGLDLLEHGWSVLWPDYYKVVPWIALVFVSLASDTLASIMRNIGQRLIPPSRAEVFPYPNYADIVL